MNILVTGGAGYVGSAVTDVLVKRGERVVVFDNLQQGHEEAVIPEAEFGIGDICNDVTLERIFKRFQIDAVMHMAAETVVEHSMTDPGRFMQNNVVGGLNLLATMMKYGVKKIIFSSSAAVYGEPQEIPIEEGHSKVPVNSYGESKLMFEHILEWYGKAYGLQHVSMRYFNAAGASDSLGEDHNPESHLIPNVLKAALDGNGGVPLFGTDYPTEDGTCIRDYIHVLDIAKAHVQALDRLGELSGKVFNLGTGGGYSVHQVIKVARKVTGAKIPVNVLPRRVGDPAVLIASSSQARSELGWRPEFTELEEIVESAWKWMKDHPNGYRD